MDWNKSVEYNEAAKQKFLRAARRQLKLLASKLLEDGTYDLRTNKGGIAVSGEVTLHSERIYVQVSQSFLGEPSEMMGILVRTCNGRKDYVGGKNNWWPLKLLDDVDALAHRVLQVINDKAAVDASRGGLRL